MGLVEKIIGSKEEDGISDGPMHQQSESMIDGALDTLSTIYRVFGDESFAIDGEIDPAAFNDACINFVRHIENGAAVTNHGIPASENGARDWAKLRRFFGDRRRQEKAFVTERLHDYRGVVDDLIGGLKQIGERDEDTAISVKHSLSEIEAAVTNGKLPEIRDALNKTVETVTGTFDKQKAEYEQRITEMNSRMSNLRQDLVAAHEEMQRDSLTDVFNRGAFDKALAQSLNARFILGQPITVIFVDLDDFKSINDQFGHAAGDDVLKSVSDCLTRSFIRKNDLVSRFGGDEFAVILNDTTADHTAILLDRLMNYLKQIVVPSAPAERRITCSCGYTEISTNDSTESLIDRVDKALYQAKANGRNQASYFPIPND